MGFCRRRVATTDDNPNHTKSPPAPQTLKLLPPESLDPAVRAQLQATPMTPSFLHLHLGIDATGLPADLECHHTVVNKWEPINAPQNMAIISIPTTLDPSLAPAGHHVVHCYAAANEPYEPWAKLKPGSPEYEAFKNERAEFLWKAVERVIPDVRQRAKVQLVGACAALVGGGGLWVMGIGGIGWSVCSFVALYQ